MITAPTAPGRTFVNRACDVLIETEFGQAITGGDLAPQGLTRITVLTDRMTGAQLRLDDEMLDFIADSLITPAERMARRIQAHYDATHAIGTRMHVRARTASMGIRGLTVDATFEKEGEDAAQVLISCGYTKAADVDLSTLTVTGDFGRRIAA